MRVSVLDRMTLTDGKKTSDGYLAAMGRISRTGIYDYLGSEVGKPEMAKVRVYRDASQVFNEDAVRSFAYKPVTRGHPPVSVTADNWATYAKGQLGGEAMRDGETLAFPLVVMDGTTIKAVDAGEVELSAGYTCDIAFTSGVTDAGEEYDAVMTDIAGNHVAIVPKGRAGSSCRLGDAWPTEITDNTPPKKETKVPHILHDGLKVDLSDAEAVQALVSKLVNDKAASDAAVATATKALTDAQAATAAAATESVTAIQAKDAEIATMTAQVATLTTQLADAQSPERLKAAAAEYAKVADTAKALGASVTDGASVADIHKAVVDAKLGDAAKDWTAEQYAVSFNTLAASAPVTDALRQSFTAPTLVTNLADARTGAMSAHAEMVERLKNPALAVAK